MNEEYQKWLRDWCARNPNPESEPLGTDIWAAAWKASRKQALSEAANKCDEWATQLTSYDSAKCATAETCAEIIREMQKE